MTAGRLPGAGHNGGPTLEPGHAWRRHAWSHARAGLLPRLPIEIVRRRVRRAAEIGLDYRTYATVHATTGRDIVALLFSTNALRMHRALRLPEDRAARLRALERCGRVVLANPPHEPSSVLEALTTGHDLIPDGAFAAPPFGAPFAALRDRMREASGRLPADGVVLVGATGWEREWAAAGRLAFYLPDDRYFGPEA